jgi:hypothetical protein
VPCSHLPLRLGALALASKFDTSNDKPRIVAYGRNGLHHVCLNDSLAKLFSHSNAGHLGQQDTVFLTVLSQRAAYN